MFYTEEDVTPSVLEATKLFGQVGNINTGKHVINNVSIATRKFGKLWYGDIDGTPGEIAQKLSQLNKFTQQTVYILDDRFDFNTPVLVINN